MESSIHIDFTDAALRAVPTLKPLRLQLGPPAAHHALFAATAGDVLRIEGMPTDPPLYVLGRSWTVMKDEVRLLLALGLASELA